MEFKRGRVAEALTALLITLSLGSTPAQSASYRDAVNPFSDAALAPEVVEEISFPLDVRPGFLAVGAGLSGGLAGEGTRFGTGLDFRLGYRWNRWFNIGASIASVAASGKTAGYRLGLDWNITLTPRSRHQFSMGLSPVFGHFGEDSFAFGLSGKRDNGLGFESRLRYDYRISRRFRIGLEAGYSYFYSPSLERFGLKVGDTTLRGLHIPRVTAVFGLDI